jgi:polysaccharide export outer membrane protein
MALAAMMAGCGTSTPSKPTTVATNSPGVDRLRVGDRVKIELSGIPDPPPPKELEIKEDGTLTFDSIGPKPAAGKSPGELEKDITADYLKGYFTHITVTITPVARFLYVMGQVNGPTGRILWTGSMTVLGAVAAAGDFTPFADKKHVKLIRVDGTIKNVNCVDALKHPEKDLPVYPGDRIQVGRRF